MSEQPMSEEPTSNYRIVQARSWTDAEPSTLTISVQCAIDTGRPYVVFNGAATWLPDDLVRSEVVPWILDCVDVVKELEEHRRYFEAFDEEG